MTGGVPNVVISNLYIEARTEESDKNQKGRGGFIEGIRIIEFVMKKLCARGHKRILFSAVKAARKSTCGQEPKPVNETIRLSEGFTLNNILAVDATAAAGFIYGLPKHR